MVLKKAILLCLGGGLLVVLTQGGMAGDGASPYPVQVIAPITEEYYRHSEGTAVQLESGRILLAWSRFRTVAGRSQDDDGPATIVMAHSDDRGHTWSEPAPLPVGDARVNIMQAAFLRSDDRLQLYFTVRDGSDAAKYVIESSDGGARWTPRRRVTPLGRRVTGPSDRVLRLSGGRILLMGHTPVPAEDGLMKPVVAWSDDGGRNWQMTEPLAFEDPAPENRIPAKVHEPAVVERRDGSLWMLARCTRGVFLASESADGGRTWSVLRASDLRTLTAPPYLKRLADGRILLLYNPPSEQEQADPRYRTTMPGYLKRHTLAARTSRDEGRTWSAPLVLARDGRNGFCYPWAIELDRSRELLVFCTRTPAVISPGALVSLRVPLDDLP